MCLASLYAIILRTLVSISHFFSANFMVFQHLNPNLALIFLAFELGGLYRRQSVPVLIDVITQRSEHHHPTVCSF